MESAHITLLLCLSFPGLAPNRSVQVFRKVGSFRAGVCVREKGGVGWGAVAGGGEWKDGTVAQILVQEQGGRARPAKASLGPLGPKISVLRKALMNLRAQDSCASAERTNESTSFFQLSLRRPQGDST